jgi:Spy/CpxP family protein refolding chaperone
MSNRSSVFAAVLGLFLIGTVPVLAQAPNGPPAEPGGGPGAGPAGAIDKHQASKQKHSDRMRDALGATAEEWAVLGPRIEKVQKIQDEIDNAVGRGISNFSADAKSKSRPPRPESTKQKSPIEEKANDLEKAMKGPDANAADLKARLAVLREARGHAEIELAKSQEELRQLLTVKQEVILVMIGVLR